MRRCDTICWILTLQRNDYKQATLTRLAGARILSIASLLTSQLDLIWKFIVQLNFTLLRQSVLSNCLECLLYINGFLG